MSENIFKGIRENINDIMEENHVDLTPKKLAEKSNISYSTLAPILRGERDFRISNLIALTQALNTSPNELLQGLYKPQSKRFNNPDINSPKYYVILVTGFGLTYCRLINQTDHTIENTIYQFPLACTDEPNHAIDKIKMIISKFHQEIEYEDTFLYISILGCEHVFGREHIRNHLNKVFDHVILEPDWMPIFSSQLINQKGILISVSNGATIVYSNKEGDITKLQGYSFPISDEGGNLWLGCEAIKHAINVKEGVESRSMLSDKILSLVNSDLNLLATKAYDTPYEFFVEVSTIVKELSTKKDMAYQIVKRGFEKLWGRIKGIDEKSGESLPVYLAGSLAYIYEDFVPKDRLVHVDFENIIENQLEYAHKKLDIAKENLKLSNRV
jgi:N-acetylglucosamine kinase-like BadF-type ATPase/DNA-binding Xre family transcriptional regulator